jgi:hypothetical protein
MRETPTRSTRLASPTWSPQHPIRRRTSRPLRTRRPGGSSGASCSPAGFGATDLFNGSSPAGSLGCADSGQTWEYAAGSAWTICNGTVACVITGADNEAWTRIQTNYVDQRITVHLPTRPISSQGSVAVMAKVANGFDDQLWVGLSATGTLDVWTAVAGVWTQKQTKPTSYDSSAIRTLIVSTVGNQLKVYVDTPVNGTPEITIANLGMPSNSAATYARLYARLDDPAAANWPRIDDFTVAAGP